jgi:hypothetical protein
MKDVITAIEVDVSQRYLATVVAHYRSLSAQLANLKRVARHMRLFEYRQKRGTHGEGAREGLRLVAHCAIIVRVYAIYETFAEFCLEDYLHIMFRCGYRMLDGDVHLNHLRKMTQWIERYGTRSTNETKEDLLYGYFAAITGESTYISTAPFTRHTENLRLSALQSLYNESGLRDVDLWLRESRHLEQFFVTHPTRLAAGGNSVEVELERLVSLRNAVAHKAELETNMLDPAGLCQLADFVDAVCAALAEYVERALTLPLCKLGVGFYLGKATRVWERAEVILLKVDNRNCLLRNGLGVNCITPYNVVRSQILELRVDDKPVDSVVSHVGLEISMKIRPVPSKGAEIWVVGMTTHALAQISQMRKK